MTTTTYTAIVSHWVKITVKSKMGGDTIEVLRWDNLPWDVRSKWSWYFKYRAALLQVKYPKSEVDYSWGNESVTGNILTNIKSNQIRAKKGKITEIKNKLELARENWNELFPIDDDEMYQKCMAKLFRLNTELKEMEELK